MCGLIGVLEYAELYVKPVAGESAFVTMLKRARECLKPGGAILLAIENRLGLKYFGGCAEDHTITSSTEFVVIGRELAHELFLGRSLATSLMKLD